jgi:hypothetical protein
VAIVAFFVALSVAFWWPLALHVPTRQLESVAIDSAYNQWILGWGSHALLHSPLHLFDANAYYPHRHVLAWGDNLFTLDVLTIFLRPLVGLVGAYNVLLLASSALTGWWTSILVRPATGRAAGVLAGALAAFTSVRVVEHGHLQILSTQWIPLVFVAAERVRRRPTPARIAALAGAAALLLATNLYLSIFTAVAFAVWSAFLAVGRRLSWRVVIGLAVGWAAATVVCLPLYLPSIRLQQSAHIVRDPLDQMSAPVEAFALTPPGRPAQWLSERLGHPLRPPGTPLVPPPTFATPGLVVLALLAAGAIACAARRRAPPAVPLAAAFALVWAIAVAASLGPAVTRHGHVLLGHNPAFWIPYRLLPGYDALRVPARWLIVASLAGGVVVAVVAAPLLSSLRRPVRIALVAAASVLVLVEQSGAPWSLGRAERLADHPALAWVARRPAGTVIVELPITGDVSSEVTQEIEGRRLLLSAMHLRRRVNGGISPYIPPHTYGDRVETVNGLGRDPQALRFLQDWDVDYVLFEPADQARYPNMRPAPEVEAALDADPGLRRLRTFRDAIVYEVLNR